MNGKQGSLGILWLSLRILICICVTGWILYSYIDKQNALVELRMILPGLSREVKAIQEENIRLQFEIDRFESPIHLMELARKPEFSHLKYPFARDVILIPVPDPLTLKEGDSP